MHKIKFFLEKVKRFLRKARTNRKRKSLIFYTRYAFILGAWVASISVIYVIYILHDLPNVEILQQRQVGKKVTILDNKEEILAVYGDMTDKYVQYYEIPRHLINAVVATEDRKFFEHSGVDPLGIMRAAFVNFRAGRTVQGGSTITQQLAKMTFLSSERKLTRKIKEAFLALEIENNYTKQEIITAYLNRAYMGSGIFGISAAAKYYFAKNVQDLNLYESAILAGLLKSPTKFSPKNNRDLSGNRAYQILLNMYEAGFINKYQIEEANHTSVILDTKLMGSVRRNYFTNWIYDQTYNYITPEESRNIIVYTTFDTKIHALAQKEFQKQMSILQKNRDTKQGAVLIMDYEGNVLSMIGGSNFSRSSFNRSIQAHRQSGSIFKTFVFSAAMEKGLSPKDLIEDKEIHYGEWTPQNFNKKFLGEITLEEGFRKSLNTVAVQLMDKVGRRHVINTAKKLGITSEIEPNLASALGASSNTLMELTTAYGSIANDGYLVKSSGVTKIINKNNDQLLYERPEGKKQRSLSPEATDKMKFLLRRAVIDGSARKAQSNFTVSGKTGTSQDFRDAWFIGYTDKHIIGVWVGNDDYSPTKYVTGGTFPTIIARNILRQIHRHKLS